MVVSDLREAGQPWSCCPRDALRRVLAAARRSAGVSIVAGFEHEFILLRPSRGSEKGALVAVDQSVYCQTSSLDAQAHVLDEMVDALAQLGIEVVQYHAESAGGQFEISTAPADAMRAADEVLLAREVISSVARQHSLVAVFAPKYDLHSAGNGAHCHISLHDVTTGANLFVGKEGERHDIHGVRLSDLGASFISGVLSHLPGLLPLTSPTPLSFLRLAAGCWAGAWCCWGVDNREAPLRLTSPHPRSGSGGAAGGSVNVEYKAMDATANVHLALAAVITAGMLGVSRQAALPPPLQVDPASLTEERRHATGVVRLPGSAVEALEALEMDTVLKAALKDAFGPELLRAALAVRRQEAADGSTSSLVFRY